jgi:hypothetical protein
MAEERYITEIVETTRQEILFAIKERISELSRGLEAPVQLKKIIIREGGRSFRDSVQYFEVNHIYVDENDRLCGDLACKGGRYVDDVFFGKSIEDLAIDDLKMILDALYGNGWSVDRISVMVGKPERSPGFFLDKFSGITRVLRKHA